MQPNSNPPAVICATTSSLYQSANYVNTHSVFKQTDVNILCLFKHFVYINELIPYCNYIVDKNNKRRE